MSDAAISKLCDAVEVLGKGMEATLTLLQQLTERVAALEGQVLVTEHGDRVEVHHHPKPEKADAIT